MQALVGEEIERRWAAVEVAAECRSVEFVAVVVEEVLVPVVAIGCKSAAVCIGRVGSLVRVLAVASRRVVDKPG